MTINVILNNVADLTNTVTAQNVINTNNNTVTVAFTSALNTAGDTMNGVLDMNSNAIINLPAPVSGQSPVRLVDITTSTTVSVALPSMTGVVVAAATAGKSVTTFSGTGNLPVSQLAGGVNATTSTFWSGAGTWASPATSAISLTAGTGIAVSLAGTTYTVRTTTPVPITATNDTNVTAVISTSTGTITMGWTGTLAQARGGIGTAPTVSAGAVVYSTSTAYLPNTAATATNFVLLSGAGGTGTPVWASPLPFAAGGVGTISGAVVRIKAQLFTASGVSTYTPSTGLLYSIIECIGGGGGGGGAGATSTANVFAGGGGGSGGYSRKVVASSVIGTSQTVTIGGGGTGGLGTLGATPIFGGTGGTTSVGTICQANGGLGGQCCNVNLAGFPGAGGTSSGAIGDITARGCLGTPGIYFTGGTSGGAVIFPSGGGANSVFGGGTVGVSGFAVLTGTDNTNGLGGGGAGGYAASTASGTPAGGTGALGICFITEFCNT